MNLSNFIFIASIAILIYGGWSIYEKYFLLEGESESDFEIHMQKNARIINNICSKLEMEARLLVSVLYAERRHNINMLDDYEGIFAHLGSNTSMGLGQVRLETAQWMMMTIPDSSNSYSLPKRYQVYLPKIQNRTELIRLLENDSTNLLMTAMHIRQILCRWEKAGFPITERPDIVTTLYTYGLYKRESGQEIKPHANPQSNNLGEWAYRFYRSNTMQDLFPAIY